MGRKLAVLAVLGLLCIAGKCGKRLVLPATQTVACLCLLYPGCAAQEEEESLPTADDDLGASRDGSRTDAEVVER